MGIRIEQGTILLTGDSVTDCGRRDDPDQLGFGYVRRLAGASELAGARVVNTGVGGDLSTDLAARWEPDVLAHRPALVSVLIGINDVWRRYDGAGRTTTAEQFAGTLRGALDRLPEQVRVVLVEPFVLPVTAEQHRWQAEDLADKRAALRALAAERGAGFVPTQDRLTAAAATEGAVALATDGVHPTDRGHELLAQAWLAAVPPAWLSDAASADWPGDAGPANRPGDAGPANRPGDAVPATASGAEH